MVCSINMCILHRFRDHTYSACDFLWPCVCVCELWTVYCRRPGWSSTRSSYSSFFCSSFCSFCTSSSRRRRTRHSSRSPASSRPRKEAKLTVQIQKQKSRNLPPWKPNVINVRHIIGPTLCCFCFTHCHGCNNISSWRPKQSLRVPIPQTLCKYFGAFSCTWIRFSYFWGTF